MSPCHNNSWIVSLKKLVKSFEWKFVSCDFMINNLYRCNDAPDTHVKMLNLVISSYLTDVYSVTLYSHNFNIIISIHNKQS